MFLLLTRALQRRSVAASIWLQRRTRHYRVSHEAPGRSSRRRSNRPFPRSKRRRPGIGTPLIRFLSLQRFPATSRCPGRPATGRSRFGVVTCTVGRCGLESLALAVFRFSAEAARGDRPWRWPIFRNRACTFCVGATCVRSCIAVLFLYRAMFRYLIVRKPIMAWPRRASAAGSTAWRRVARGNAHGILALRSLAPAGGVRDVSTQLFLRASIPTSPPAVSWPDASIGFHRGINRVHAHGSLRFPWNWMITRLDA